MISYLKVPNLPQNHIKDIIIGKKYSEIFKNQFHKLNIIVHEMPNNNLIDERLSGHADMTICHLGNNKFIVSSILQNTTLLNDLHRMKCNINYTLNTQSNEYPYDAILNICILGNKIICNKDIIDKQLTNLLISENIINCKQGYSKCSICIVNDNAIITSDKGIAKIAEKNSIDVLLINDNLVELAGFNCGFIGGSTFKISSDKLAFTGIIDNTSEKNRIENFLMKYNVSPVYLTDKKLFDIGGIIAITEY